MSKTNQLLGKLLSEQIKHSSTQTDINEVEYSVYSQFGEDGIIQFITHHLKDTIKNEIFIEIGVEDYTEANTRFLLENNGWKGVVIDCVEECIAKIQTSDFFWRNHLFAKKAFITQDNINEIISELNLPKEIGLFSLDIDGNDYWVLKKLLENAQQFRPAIIIVEYNSFFGSELAISVPYREDFRWKKFHPTSIFGASLGAFCHLLDSYEYELLGSTRAGNNAFFVHKNINRQKLKTLTCKQGYKQALFNSIPCKTFNKFEEQLLPLRYQQVFDVQNKRWLRLADTFVTEQSVTDAFNCIADFMMHDQEVFVLNAYRYLLCREPADSEIEIFMSQLRLNVSKEEILKAIHFSEEGKNVAVYIEGLSDKMNFSGFLETF